MLFPEEPVRWLTERDRWLVNRYRLPPRRDMGMSYPVLDNDDRIPAPPELIAEVDRAYFRLELQNDVDDWFVRNGLDPTAPTILKHLFEAAVQAEFGRLPPERIEPIEKYKRITGDDALVAEAVAGLKSKKYPNVNQAAQAVAPRATGSEQAKVRRLSRKIAKALQRLNVSKRVRTNRNK